MRNLRNQTDTELGARGIRGRNGHGLCQYLCLNHKRGAGQRPEEGPWEDCRKKVTLALRDGPGAKVQGGRWGRILTHAISSTCGASGVGQRGKWETSRDGKWGVSGVDLGETEAAGGVALSSPVAELFLIRGVRPWVTRLSREPISTLQLLLASPEPFLFDLTFSFIAPLWNCSGEHNTCLTSPGCHGV